MHLGRQVRQFGLPDLADDMEVISQRFGLTSTLSQEGWIRGEVEREVMEKEREICPQWSDRKLDILFR